MSTEIAKLTVALEAQTAKFSRDLDATNRKIASFEKRTQASLAKSGAAFQKFGGMLKGFVGAYLGTQLFGQIIKETAEAEKTFAMLQNAVANNGKQAGYTAQQLADMAKDIQGLTTYSDEAVMSMQALLLRFRDIGDFKAAQTAVLDLAAAMNMDLQAAAKLVGRALADPVKGLTMMTRAGISFTGAQKEVIKSLVESGKKAEAQKYILDTLQGTMKGAAEAARNNLGGAIEGLKNDFGEMLEMKSGVPGVTEAINNLAATIRDPAIAAGISALFGGIITLATQAITVVAKLAGVMSTLMLGGSKRVDQITQQIEWLEKQRGSLIPSLSIGKTFDPTGKGGITWLTDDKIEKRIAQLRREQDVLLGLGTKATKEERIKYGLEIPGGGGMGAPEEDEYTGGGGGGGKKVSEAEKATEAIQQQTAALQQQLDTLGASEAGLAAYRATQGDLADEFRAMGPAGEVAREKYIALAVALQDATFAQEAELAATEQANALKQEAAQLVEGLKTEYDRASDAVDRYNLLLEKGVLTEAQRDALIRKTSEGLAELAEKSNAATKQMSIQWDQALRNMQDILADALFDSFDDGVKGMLLAWAQALKRMAAEALAANIFGALTAGAKGASGWLGGILGAVFGGVTVGGGAAAAAAGGGGGGFGTGFGGFKASGGPINPGKWYMVGEEGPELVMPRQPGMVLPAQTSRRLLERQDDDPALRPVQVTMHIETPNAESFMRTQTQIQARLHTALQRASARKN